MSRGISLADSVFYMRVSIAWSLYFGIFHSNCASSYISRQASLILILLVTDSKILDSRYPYDFSDLALVLSNCLCGMLNWMKGGCHRACGGLTSFVEGASGRL